MSDLFGLFLTAEDLKKLRYVVSVAHDESAIDDDDERHLNELLGSHYQTQTPKPDAPEPAALPVEPLIAEL